MRAEFSHAVDFLTVYTQEAHPAELWPLPRSRFSIRTHASLRQRLHAAALLAESGAVPREELVVDGMDDPMGHVYGALPSRLMVIQDGVLTYLGGSVPLHHSTSKLGDFLRSLGLPTTGGEAEQRVYPVEDCSD